MTHVDTAATIQARLNGRERSAQRDLYNRLTRKHGLVATQSGPLLWHWYGPRAAMDAACREWNDARGLAQPEPYKPVQIVVDTS